MFFIIICWYVCWVFDIIVVGEIKKNFLNVFECNDEEWEFYERYKSMFRCKIEGMEYVCNVFNNLVVGLGEKNWYVVCVCFLFRFLCW